MSKFKYWKRIIGLLLVITLVCQYGSMLHVSAKAETVSSQTTSTEINEENESLTEEQTSAVSEETTQEATETTAQEESSEEVKETTTQEATSEAKVVAETTTQEAKETTKEEQSEEETTKGRLKAKINNGSSVPEVDMKSYITDCSIEAMINGSLVDVNTITTNIIPKNAEIKVTIGYEPTNVTFEKNSDTLYYQLPKGILIPTEITGKRVKDTETGAEVGNYSIDTSGMIKINFDQSYIDSAEGNFTEGTVSFSASFDQSYWKKGGDKEITFGNLEAIPLHFIKYDDQKDLTIEKSVVGDGVQKDDNGSYIEYQLVATAPAGNTETMPSVTVNDVFTAGANYLNLSQYSTVSATHGSLALKSGSTDTFVWTIGDMEPGQVDTINFKIYLAACSVDKETVHTIKNQAEIFSSGTTKGKSEVITVNNQVDFTILKLATDGDSESGNDSRYNGSKAVYTRYPEGEAEEGYSGYIEYRVKVTAPKTNGWTVTDMKIYDEPNNDMAHKTGLKYDTDSIQIQTDGGAYETVSSDNYWFTTNGDSPTLKNSQKKQTVLVVKIGDMAPGQTKILKYKVKISDKYFLGISGEDLTENYMSKYTKTEKDGNVTYNIESGSMSDGYISNRATINELDNSSKWTYHTQKGLEKTWINKAGKAHNKNTAHFTIQGNKTTINNGKINCPIFEDQTLTFKDTLDSDWQYNGQITIKVYNYTDNKTLLSDEDLQKIVDNAEVPTQIGTDESGNKCLVFTPQDTNNWTWTSPEGYGKYYYVFEYDVTLRNEDAIGYLNINNDAKVGVGIKGTTYWYNVSTNTGVNGNTNYRYPAVNKEFVSLNEDSSNLVAEWKSSLTQNVTAKSVYTDWCLVNSTSSGSWSMTADQINNIKVCSDGGSKVLEKGKDFKVNGDYTENSGDKKRVGFEITFLHDIEASEDSPITIVYQTTLSTTSKKTGKDLTNGELQNYQNYASLTIGRYTDETSAICPYLKEQKIGKSAKYEENSDIITWTIKVNGTGGMKGEATIVDDLSGEGLEFTKTYTKEDIEAALKKQEYSQNVKVESVTQEGTQKITIKLSGLQNTNKENAYVEFDLETRITEQEFLLGNGDPVSIKNKAVIYYNGSTQSAEATQQVSNKSMDKKGFYDTDENSVTGGNIKFVVYVNPNKFDMLKNSDTIRLEDTLGYNMLPDSKTLVVQEVETRDPDDPEKDVMKGDPIDVSDSLVIEQNVFTFDVPDDKYLKITYEAYVTGENPMNVKISNTISYSGVGYTNPTEWSDNVLVVDSGATIGAYSYFKIQKIDGTNMKDPLPNAKYEIYEVNQDTGEINEGSKVTVVSNEEGLVTFKVKNKGVYAFKEVSAPEGYYIDAENKEFTYIAFKQSVANNVKNFDTSKILIVKNNAVMERYNYKGEITIDKSFVGGEIADGNYYFGLFDSDDKLVKTTSLKVKNGSFTYPTTFRNVDFGTYTVYETDKDGNKLTKLTGDDADVTVINSTKYIISGEGEVTVTEDSPKAKIEITNTYKPLTVAFQGTKSYNASVMKEFKFLLIDSDNNKVETVENDENGFFEFSPLTFTSKDAGKTYTYTVREAVPTGVSEEKQTKAGITYDLTKHKIEVQITQDEKTGLNAIVTIDGSAVKGNKGVYMISGTDGNTSSFTNTYSATGTLTIKGTKNLVSDDGSTPEMKAGAYTFAITSKDGTNEKEVASGTNDENGKFEITLPDFNETNIGETYKYVVKEEAGSDSRTTYDTTEYELSVTVKDNKDGTLGFETLVDGNKYDDTKIVFTNAYGFRGNVVLTKTDATDTSKKLEGATFTLYNKEDGKEVVTKVTDENGEIRVGNLKAGNYYFEETKAPAGYSYDTNNNRYEFTIANDGTNNAVEVKATNTQKLGTLKLHKTDANGEPLNGVKFNLYKVGDSAPYDTYTSDANGIVTADNLPWGDYYFKECETVAGYVLDEQATKTVTIDAAYVDGAVTTLEMTNTKVQFAKVDSTNTTKSVSGATLQITTPDNTTMTWNSGDAISTQLKPGLYTIKEVTTPTGYLAIPEGTSFILNTDGSITTTDTTGTYIATRTETDNSVTILIKDKPVTPASVVLKATKTVKDAVESDYAAAKSFTFDLYEDGNETPIDTQTVEVIGSSVESILFNKITYSEAATKTYTVKERIPSGDDKLAGITYDDTVYTIKVTVKKTNQGLDVKVEQVGDTTTTIEKENGVYELPKRTVEGLAADESASFVNVYSTSTTLTLEGTKTVSGITGGTPSAEAYQFILTDTADNTIATAKNDADGKFKFELNYTDKNITKEQPLVYTIEEDKDYNKQTGVDYDKNVYTVQVTVSDDGNGNLTATKKILLGDVEKDAITFTNTFKGSVTLTKTNGKTGDARSVLSGAKFKLYKKDGTLVGDERTTNSDGQITVNDLAEGEYYFVETEAPTGYVLDSTTHYEFTIDQDGNTDLAKANVSLEVSNTEKTGSIKLTKTGANSAKLAGAEFKLQRKVDNTFVDYTVDNQVVTGTTDANGEITFMNLPWGSYQLVETQAPAGYILDATPTSEVEITASNVDTTQTVSKTNAQNKVVIKKVDAEDTTKNLSGAKLNLYEKAEGANSTNTLIESWTSSATSTSWTLEGKLEGGKTYIIEEETAPTGYLATSNIEFTMNTDGTVTNTSAEVKTENGTQVIYVKDSTTQPVSVTIKGTKLLENGDDNHQKTFTFGLFKKGETTAKYTTTAVVGSQAGELTFPALSYSDAADEEYEIREIAPTGVTASSPTKDGITYDLSTAYSVHIVVTKDQTSGLTLKINDAVQALDENSAATYELPKGDKAASFVNTYSAKKTLTISGKKTLNGGAALKNEAYSFTIASYTATDNTASTPTTIATVKNDASGTFTFTLPEFTQSDRNQTFTYQVKEVDTGVKGVTYDTTTHTVAVTVNDNGSGELSFTVVYDGGSNTGIEFVNNFNGEAELTKTDATTGQALSGAVFKLCKKDGTVVKEKLTTGSDGKISVSSLAEGEYYFEETAAPTGYELSTAKHAFTISQDGTTASDNAKVSLTATNKEKTGSITLLKTDASGNPLKGAEFKLYKDDKVQKDGDTEKVYTTDKNGKIELTGLAWGTYYFVETKAPEGYSLDITPTTSVTIDATHVDAIQMITKVNQMLKSLTLSKKVKGEFASLTKTFKFTITLKTTNGTTTTPLTGKYAVTSSVISGTSAKAPSISTITFTNGVAEVELSHGQSITIEGLPYNYTIDSIVEGKVSGYTATITAPADATIDNSNRKVELKDSSKIEKSTTIAYTNEFASPSPTGIDMDTMLYAMIFGMGMIMLALFLIRRRKRG